MVGKLGGQVTNVMWGKCGRREDQFLRGGTSWLWICWEEKRRIALNFVDDERVDESREELKRGTDKMQKGRGLGPSRKLEGWEWGVRL